MNNDIELEGRPRPLSAGLWTLFSWLRRDDRFGSSESISSAGSDRTVASIAFLKPAHYQTAKGPILLPPPGPPTDSYKRRVHDRNLRRHHDRDLTLHRKYGLYKSEGVTTSYDAFSLPPARKNNSEFGNRWDRERRATSECYQRRLAHVPGKRRAPLPPSSISAGSPTSLTRRGTRKRPAPQPPVQFEKNKENLKSLEINPTATLMNSNSYHGKPKLRQNDVTMGCKPEKYSKKEVSTKDGKIKPEKSFLKQIFDSKKRNSIIDTSTVKILPSISELDKQAAEIIETCKLKSSEQNNNTTLENINQAESWICIRCLRKYNSAVVTCVFCLSNQKTKCSERVPDDKVVTSKASSSYTQTENVHKLSRNKNDVAEDKQKLKEMLKEMKDSLPKRPKHESSNKLGNRSPLENTDKNYLTEMPTLRVGSSSRDEKKGLRQSSADSQPSTSNEFKSAPEAVLSTNKPCPTTEKTALVAQVISAYKKNVNNHLDLVVHRANSTNQIVARNPLVDIQVEVNKSRQENLLQKESNKVIEQKDALHTPLKISSLLNPMYIPKNPVLDKPQLTTVTQPDSKIEKSKLDEVNAHKSKINKISSNKCASILASEVLTGPSTSGISVSPLNIDKIENKLKINIEKCSKEDLIPPQKEEPILLKDEKRVLESELKEQEKISNIPSPLKENILSNNTEQHNQHSRRRDLINQLEKSIAKGDERAAAEAAAKLAQLRLSCSVLSFSSQILSQPSTSSSSSSSNNVEKKPSEIEIKQNIPTKNYKSHQKMQGEPQSEASSSVKAKSSTKELISKVTPVAVLTPNKSQVAAPEIKAELPKALHLQNNKGVVVQQNLCNAKEETSNTNDDNRITIAVLVEDREATRGPVHLRINRQAMMRDLRQEAETSLGVATNLQRWIVGRALCVNDNTPIVSLAGPDFTAPFYLCVVESETKNERISQISKVTANKDTNTHKSQNKAGNVYTELVQLEQQALVPNAENFECGVCMEVYPPGQGVVLRECVHIFCKDCLSDVVRHCEEPDIPCPAMGCRGMLQEREIRALVTPLDYERWLARGLAAAESGTRNAFHCRTRDCKGWALCEPGVQRFPCPVCKRINCVPCQVIHDGETCEQHRSKLKQAAEKKTNTNEPDDGTRTLLNSLISKGEALECPECSAIITKKWGCDWVKCSACKTEICWVTRGRRWGPAGKGDISGGCRCGVDGKRCHPSCGYCH